MPLDGVSGTIKNRLEAVCAPRGTLFEGLSLTGQANPGFDSCTSMV
jgi:hypothetical protein